MKTYSQKPTDVSRKWHLIDAADVSFGRVATAAASLLIGKGKPTFTPHVDGGDHVVIINADKVKITGAKEADKTYHHHSGYPGGLRTQTLGDISNVAVIEEAIRGMLPANKLKPARFGRLKVYAGAEHSHAAQQPEVYEIKGKK